MAWLEQHSSSGHFKICFRRGGANKRKSLPITDSNSAEAILLPFEENVALLERGRLEMHGFWRQSRVAELCFSESARKPTAALVS